MKNQLSKKLSACLPVGMAFIVIAMMFSVSANAQIVYSDVNPDVSDTCTSTSISQPCNKADSIDLNNDGIFDLKISLATSKTLTNPPQRNGSVKVSPLNGTQIRTDDFANPLFMNLNDLIGANFSWYTAANQTLISRSQPGSLTGITYSGNWITATDNYLGLKIISGSETNYGWVRLNVEVNVTSSPFATFTLKDYAYNPIPNQPILAGDTMNVTTGIIENIASLINLFPNPANNHLTIALGSNNKKVEVTIADITGKVIYTTTASETQKIEVDTKDFAEGIYVVQIQTADFIVTKKLVVEK